MPHHIPARPYIKAPPLSFATRIGDMIYVSGIPAFDADGTIPDAFDAQFAIVDARLTPNSARNDAAKIPQFPC